MGRYNKHSGLSFANASRTKVVGWLGGITLFLLLAVLSRPVPPIQSPDETGHLVRAAMLSHGQWIGETPADLDTGGWIDAGLNELLFVATSIVGKSEGKLTPADKYTIRHLAWRGEKVFVQIHGLNYYLPVLYAPHAAALAVGRVLNWSVARTYDLMRMALWASCVGLLVAAWRQWRPSPIVLGLLALPMSLFQAISPTIDALSACLVVWIVSVFQRALREPGQQSFLGFMVWTMAVVVAATGRPHMLPLLAFPLFLSWALRSGRLLFVSMMATLCSAGWVLWMMRVTRDTRIERPQSTREILAHYLTHPVEVLQTISRTLANEDKQQFYFETFVGRLGWLDAPLTHESMYGVLGWGLVGLIALSMTQSTMRVLPRSSEEAEIVRARRFETGGRLVLIAAAVGSAFLAFFAMLISWNPLPATLIEGVQGRYLLPSALMLGFAVSGVFPVSFRGQGLIRGGAVALFVVACVAAYWTTVVQRYQ